MYHYFQLNTIVSMVYIFKKNGNIHPNDIIYPQSFKSNFS
jgi:hypothetical protein